MPISSAVSDSVVREFSKRPQSTHRSPLIEVMSLAARRLSALLVAAEKDILVEPMLKVAKHRGAHRVQGTDHADTVRHKLAGLLGR